MKEQIEIPLSKKKLFFAFIGSLAFVGIGIWLTSNPPKTNGFIFGNPAVVKTIGILNLFFFGLCAIIIGRKLTDNKPGLIFDANGITDNSNALAPGLIPWKEITGVSIKSVFNQKFILIEVQDPQHFIGIQANKWKKKMLAWNSKANGTPLSISANNLQISFDALQNLLNAQLKMHQ